jgi:hypothetical protein
MEYHHKGPLIIIIKIKNQNPGLGRKSHGYSFFGHRWCYSHDFLEPGTIINSALHCNTKNFETIIKKSLEAQEECFAAT